MGSPSSLVMAATAAAREAAALAREAAVLAREARQREPMAQQVVQHLAQVGSGGSGLEDLADGPFHSFYFKLSHAIAIYTSETA